MNDKSKVLNTVFPFQQVKIIYAYLYVQSLIHNSKIQKTENQKVFLWFVANLFGSKTRAERMCSHLQFLFISISVNTSHLGPRVTSSPFCLALRSSLDMEVTVIKLG